MTRMTGPDCAVMCNLINTHTHTHTNDVVSSERLLPVDSAVLMSKLALRIFTHNMVLRQDVCSSLMVLAAFRRTKPPLSKSA